MVPTTLEDLDQLCQTFRGKEPANPSSINGYPTSTRTQQKKGKRVSIKNKNGLPYLQYQIKLAASKLPLTQEHVAAVLPHHPYHPPFHYQVRLLKSKVRSLENNKDITNGLEQKNKGTIKNLGVAVYRNQ